MEKKFKLLSVDEKELIDITVNFDIVIGKYQQQVDLDYNIDDCLIEVNTVVVDKLSEVDRVYCMDQIDTWIKKEIEKNGFDLWYNQKENERIYEGNEV